MDELGLTDEELAEQLEQFDAEDHTVEEMSEDELQGIVSREVDDSVAWMESWISTERAKLMDYYHGRPFGNEEEGRSQVVSTDVRDTVQAILPPLMRLFFGGESVVEFVPRGPEDEESAKQATDYVNYIVQSDNPGFKIFYEAFKDALVTKTGIIKYWWDESQDTTTWEMTGIDENGMNVLVSDPEVDLDINAQYMGEDGLELYDVTATRTASNGRVKITSVPQEEFLISNRAVDIEEANMVGHRRMLPVSDLVRMGYDYDKMLEAVGHDDLDLSQERLARRIDRTVPTDNDVHDSMRLVSYTEAYIYVDYDNDGIAELRKICMVGSGNEIIANEPIPFRPFIDLCPDPEPHTWLGSGIGDVTSDIQRIKSAIMRNMLDSLALSTTPRMSVVEGQVNMDDILNTEVGAIVRMRQPGMAQAIETPFVGQHAFTALNYMDDLRENRTGITRAAVGLDPNALQSATKEAVNSTIGAAHERVDLIARIFAEMGITPLFRGILKLITTHQDQARTIRLNNKWVEIDPRGWNAGMDTVTNVGLGTGDLNTKLSFLNAIAAKQENAIQTMGPSNPIAGLGEYRNTLAAITGMMGFKNPAKFFTDPATYQPPQEQEAAPDPNIIIAQAEMLKAQAGVENDRAELALKREEMLREDDRKRDELDADIALRAAEIRGKYQTQVDVAGIKADIDRDRNKDNADVDIIKSMGMGQPLNG